MAARNDDTIERLQVILETRPDSDISEHVDELITLASNRLMQITRKMLRSYPRLRRWEQTDDVFQKAAIRLYKSLSDVRPENVRSFMGLASTQVRRTLVDLARHYFGAVGIGTKHESTERAGPIAGNPPAANDSKETLEMWSRFHAAVEALPDPEQEAFSLIWYGGMTQRQVAGLTNVSERTVKRRFYSARIRLASCLETDSEEGN